MTDTDTPETTAAAPAPAGIALSSGRIVHLREPTAGELRGIKLLDVLQLDPAAHAAVIGRISEVMPAEFYALRPADTMTLMTAVVGFFEQETVSPQA